MDRLSEEELRRRAIAIYRRRLTLWKRRQNKERGSSVFKQGGLPTNPLNESNVTTTLMGSSTIVPTTTVGYWVAALTFDSNGPWLGYLGHQSVGTSLFVMFLCAGLHLLCNRIAQKRRHKFGQTLKDSQEKKTIISSLRAPRLVAEAPGEQQRRLVAQLEANEFGRSRDNMDMAERQMNRCRGRPNDLEWPIHRAAYGREIFAEMPARVNEMRAFIANPVRPVARAKAKPNETITRTIQSVITTTTDARTVPTSIAKPPTSLAAPQSALTQQSSGPVAATSFADQRTQLSVNNKAPSLVKPTPK